MGRWNIYCLALILLAGQGLLLASFTPAEDNTAAAVARSAPLPTTIEPGGTRSTPTPSTAIVQTASPAEPSVEPEFRAALSTQILLDRRHFSCGCLDGVMGSRTREAVSAWQEAHGLPVTGEWDAATMAGLGPTDTLLGRYVITSNEVATIAPNPPTWLEKSKALNLGYETILEYIAEKTHTTEGTIRRLNPDADWPNPAAGTSLLVPQPLSKKPGTAARVRIRLGRKTIQALDAEGVVIAHFPCSIARKVENRPVGELHVMTVAPNPNYVFDPALFSEEAESRTLRGKLMLPPGPNNPVGTAWIGLDKPGYGIHGSPHPEDIGKTESHGCFRLANWNAETLIRMVTVGTPVTVEP